MAAPTKFPERDDYGRERTAYAVKCGGPFDVPGGAHGLVYLSVEEYDEQMPRPDSTWRCPICRYGAYFVDENWEQVTGYDEDEEEEA